MKATFNKASRELKIEENRRKYVYDVDEFPFTSLIEIEGEIYDVFLDWDGERHLLFVNDILEELTVE
jgi:hypothetical protein